MLWCQAMQSTLVAGGQHFHLLLFDLPNRVLRWSSILFVMSVDEVFVNELDVAVCFGAK